MWLSRDSLTPSTLFSKSFQYFLLMLYFIYCYCFNNITIISTFFFASTKIFTKHAQKLWSTTTKYTRICTPRNGTKNKYIYLFIYDDSDDNSEQTITKSDQNLFTLVFFFIDRWAICWTFFIHSLNSLQCVYTRDFHFSLFVRYQNLHFPSIWDEKHQN